MNSGPIDGSTSLILSSCQLQARSCYIQACMDSAAFLGEALESLIMPPHYSRLVLIVDDDPSDRKLFSRELERHGLQVAATGSAEEAMAAIVDGKIGCLIADQVMTVRGQELAEIAAGVSRDLGVIVFSGAPHPRDPIPAGALFVSKDDLPKLIQLVTECMERWRTQN